MRRRRFRSAGGLKRSPDWAAYNFGNNPTSVATGTGEVFVDWFKLPGGVFDPVTNDLEPRDDTLTQLLSWGSWSVNADNTTTGEIALHLGIIEWHGNSDVPPAIGGTDFPTPGSYPQAEWIWWNYAGGTTNIPGNGLVTTTIPFADWHYRSAAKRKLPENVGLLIVAEMDNLSGEDIIVYPNWKFRYMLLGGSHVKPRGS